MLHFNIDTDDLHKIESLLKNNTNIDKLYTKLYTIELDGKKNSDEYIKHLEYLLIFLEFEEKIYKDANLSIEKALSWIIFLNKKSDNKIVSRIIYNLFSIITTKYSELMVLSYEGLQHIAKTLSITASGTNKETISSCIVLKDNIEKNMYYTFLNFLEAYIESTANGELKNNLIAGKYNTLFTNPKIEKIVLANKFDVSPIPHVIEDSHKILPSLNSNLYKCVKDLISSTIANGEIKELLQINDIDYNDIQKTTTAIYRQCMLRSAFQIMSDEKISDLNIDFHEYVESEEYLNNHQNNCISYNLIIYDFREINNDKKKRKIL